MQRDSSRRRKPRPADKLEEPIDSARSDTPQKHKKEASSRDWPCGLVLYPLALCLVVVLLLWNQYTTRLVLPSSFFSPTRIHHEPNLEEHDVLMKSPDDSRPQIELHPKHHIYRDPATHYLDWTVTAGNLRPDGVLKDVHLINGLFPGPTIEARSGDTVIVNVTNALQDESFTVHWHGLHIQSKYSMDGVAAVTQRPILPGASFLYHIDIPSDQSGTFWYHGHAGLARADGLYGGFVVHKPAPKSTVRGLMSREGDVSLNRGADEKDVLLMIGDWYHRPAAEVMAWYMRAGSFGNEPVPDSLVLNGIGYFNCSMAVPARPLDCIDSPINLSRVLPTDAVCRVRVVNTGSLAGFTLTFDNHDVTVLEVDSAPVQAQQGTRSMHSVGILYPGQRMDLLIRRSTDDKSSTLKIHLDEECFKYPNPALKSTQTFFMSEGQDETEPTHIAAEPPSNEQQISSLIDVQDLPSTEQILSQIPPSAAVQRTEVVYTKIQKLSIRHNVPYGFFNRTSWVPQMDPAIPLNELERERWDKNQFGITIPSPPSLHQRDEGEQGIWVDLVVNNLDEGGHPFHLHGHHFYILAVYKAAIGWGSYNPFVDPSPPGLDPERFPETKGYDLSRAMLRDTVYIPSRAYAVLRFRADNPGIWLFHCHILWHLANGMSMLVDVGGV
ncbi:hypothetical protein AOCH_000182 [Aspergillus ochraceoroseus]|uniref:Laccase n=1 Tax=Aspergillus ochraceoroseus TaxID=138278 RepID=A0A0F8VFP1_9EURO|nr:hypothetical protein AOCH_000182 [Aspergillus ochraceoroseus]